MQHQACQSKSRMSFVHWPSPNTRAVSLVVVEPQQCQVTFCVSLNTVSSLSCSLNHMTIFAKFLQNQNRFAMLQELAACIHTGVQILAGFSEFSLTQTVCLAWLTFIPHASQIGCQWANTRCKFKTSKRRLMCIIQLHIHNHCYACRNQSRADIDVWAARAILLLHFGLPTIWLDGGPIVH